MIHLERLPKPQILETNQKEWTDKFITSGKKRPDGSKYGHKEIRGFLNAMSFGKCYYCEKKISHERQEIDHFIEVSDAEGRHLAFDWDNLFLACDNCNRKLNNTTIPVTDVLNPFKHSDGEIQSHLDFENEHIIARNNSELAYKTIQKFRLDTPLLDLLRSRQLNLFKDVIIKINENQLTEKRHIINQKESDVLRRFAQKDHAFSFMFKNLLGKKGLL